MKKIIGISTLVALTACGEPAPSPKAQFTDNAAKDFLAAFVPTQVNLRRAVTIGSTAAQNGNADESVRGVCRIVEDRYEASVNVPGTVELPAYLDGARPVTVTCSYADQRVEQVIQPVNLSRQSRISGNVGLALLCPICGVGSALAGASQGADREGDVFGFDAINIEVE